MAKKKRKVQLILDASVALAWFFKDEADPYADALARRLPTVEVIVPTIWHIEIANALLMGERRKRCTSEQTDKWTSYLTTLLIEVDEETSGRAWKEILDLARAQHLTVYDAAYLELALRRNLPIASLDKRLKNAASKLGISEFKP
jgi:predicted nucleic acid-binding protein